MLKNLPFIGLLFAVLLSPASAQNFICPTAPFGTNDNKCASTAFVQGAVSGSVAGVASFNGRTGVVVPATNDYSFSQISGTNSVAKGGTGTTSFTNNLPLIGNLSGPLTQGTISGSTTTFVTTTGALASGDCVEIDSNGNFVDAGAACGAGGGGSISGPATTTSGYLPTWGNSLGTLLGTGYPVGTTGASTVLLTGSGGLISASVLPVFTGAVTISSGVTSYNEVVPANMGGAGAISGALKANGSGTVSQAAASDLSNGTTGTGAVVLAASPTLTGAPLAPTASPGTNTTQLATTAFVQAAVAGGGASTPYVQDFSSPGAVNSLILTVGSPPVSSALLHVYFDGIDQAHNTWSLAGSIITFNANIPTNTQTVEAQWLSPALAAGVNSLGGMTGAILCGTGLSCAAGTVSVSTGSLPALTNGYIWIGNGSNAAVAEPISGDVSLSNAGLVTLNSVNSNVGSFGSPTTVPVFVVNAKGLITSVAATAITAPSNTLSGTILNSTVVASSLTSVGALTSGSIGGSGFGINLSTTSLSGTIPIANLPVATSSSLGVMRTDGSTLSVTAGLVSCTPGSTSQVGCLKIDGSTIQINGSGAIFSTSSGSSYTIFCSNGSDQSGAINAALAAGGTVTLSPGICNISSAIAWTNGVPATLKGAGQSLTVINQTSGSANGICVQCTGTATPLNYAGGIYDLTVKGSLANTANGIDVAYVGPGQNGPSGWEINNVTVIGFTYGIRYNHEWYTRNANIEIDNALTADIVIGDATTGNSGGDAWNNIQLLQTSGTNTSGICVSIIDTGGQYWSNVGCTATQYGVYVHPGAGQTAANIEFSNSIMDNNGLHGWMLDTAGTGTIYHFYCTNCWGDYANSSGGGNGFVINGTSGSIISHVAISNSNFNLNRCQGVYIVYGYDIRISGSTITDNFAGQGGACAGAPSAEAGIHVAAATNNLSLTNNFIGNSTSTGGSQVYGIYATSTVVSASDYWTITSASGFHTNTGAGLCFDSSGVPTCTSTATTHNAVANNL